MRDRDLYALKFLTGGNPYGLALFPPMENRIFSLVISENSFLLQFLKQTREDLKCCLREVGGSELWTCLNLSRSQ